MTNRVVLDVVQGPNAIAGCRLASDSVTRDGSNRVRTTWPDYQVGGLAFWPILRQICNDQSSGGRA